jgi:hypothetical protein
LQKVVGAAMKGVNHYKKNGDLFTGNSHKMPNGSLHSGKVHGKTSVPLFHFKDLSTTAKKKVKK